MIHCSHQLNEQQLQELQQLAQHCKKQDGSIPNLYTHILTQHRAFPSNIFYYEQQQLIGFLSVYFFYDEAVEVSVLVHPSFRKQGIAKALLHEVLPLIQAQNYSAVIFSTPEQLHNQWLPNRGYTYLHSEYYMERSDRSPILRYHQNLSYRIALTDDIPALCVLDKHCFPHKHGDLVERFQHIIDNREYCLILALHNSTLIGKAHLRWQEQGASLSDIAIIPEQQGKGFGTALITYCINYALSEGKPLLNLDVEAHNQKALNLYIKLGFATQNACDFWSISMDQLIGTVGA